MLRLNHPGQVGKFAAGIFVGTLLQIVALLVTDIAGLAAMVHNFRRLESAPDSARMASRFFGGIFVLMGLLVILGGAHVDKYHNLLHLGWGAFALGVSFLSEAAAKRFCIATGAFYLSLAGLGLTLGNPVLGRAWYFGPILLHTGDHIFHMVLGSFFLGMGLVSGRLWRRSKNAGVGFGHGAVGQKAQRY
jgi:hypothetical protein